MFACARYRNEKEINVEYLKRFLRRFLRIDCLYVKCKSKNVSFYTFYTYIIHTHIVAFETWMMLYFLGGLSTSVIDFC